MKNVIVEGIDCSGKSTLIKNLKFGLKKHGGYDVKELEHKECPSQFRRYMLEYSLAERIIFDRAHISEAVFGKILRNKFPFSDRESNMLNGFVRNDFITILAIPSYDDFQSRYQESKKLQVISNNDFDLINKEFMLYCKEINPIIYNSSTFGYLEVFNKNIIDEIINL